MKKKTLLSSILVMALCLSIIAGSTFALFTDEKKLNIAVTSGNVEVDARLEVATLWSALATDGDAEDKYLVDEYGHNYVHEDRTSEGTFTNGGTAKVDTTTGQLVVEKITPGDKVVAKIFVQNTGDVSMIYRYVIVADETSTKLADGMIFSTDVGSTSEAAFTAKRYVSAWSDPVAANTAEIEHLISLELPVYAGDEYQSETEAQPHGKSETLQKVTYTITVEAVQGNAGMVDETNAGVPVTTTVNAATGKTEVKETTVLASNGYSAKIPAGTTLENGATTTTLTVTDDEASTGNFDFSANGAKTKGLNISIPEVADDNTKPITVTLNGVLDTGLTNVILFHKGVPMTSVARANLVKADGEFYYDVATGNVTLATASFSNFTAVVLNSIEVANEAQLTQAVAAGKNVVLTSNITLTKTLLIKKNVVIDLNGYTVGANITSGSLLQSSSDTDPNVIITSSKSGAAINAGNKSVLLGYGSTSIYNVEINAGEIKSALFNIYGDLTLGKGTVVNVEYLGTSLISNNGKVAIVIDGAKINVGTFNVNGGAMISCNAATVLEIKNANVNVVLDTKYTSYFVSKAEKTTIADDCTFKVTDANGATYHIEYKPDANVGARYIWVKN